MSCSRLSMRLTRICSRLTNLRDQIQPDDTPDFIDDRARLSLAAELILQVTEHLKEGGRE